MQQKYQILAEGNCVAQFCSFSDDQIVSEPSLRIIDGFSISPNSKFIAIFSYQEDMDLNSLQVINLINSQLMFEFNFWGNCKDSKFFQFSLDSKYLAYYSIQKQLYILSLITWTQECVDQVEYVYKLDDKNQIFIYKNKCIQTYSIEQNSLKYIVEKIEYDVSLQITAEIYLGEIYKLLIQYNNVLDIFYAKPNISKGYYMATNGKQVFITECKLLIIQYEPLYNRIIQLRNLRNGRLLRNAQSKGIPNKNLIQDNQFFYESELNRKAKVCNRFNLIQDNHIFYISEFNQETMVYNQFNLILGQNKEMIINVPYPSGKVYITNSILIDIDKFFLKLRYFVFVNQQ